MYRHTVFCFNVLSALESAADSQSGSYGLCGNVAGVLSPCDTGQVITSAVFTIDGQHEITDFSAQWSFPQGRGLANGPPQKDVISLLTGFDDNISGKQADDQLCSFASFIIEGTKLPEDMNVVTFLQCKPPQELFPYNYVEFVVCSRKSLHGYHSLVKLFSSTFVGRIGELQQRPTDFCIIVIDRFVHSSPPV